MKKLLASSPIQTPHTTQIPPYALLDLKLLPPAAAAGAGAKFSFLAAAAAVVFFAATPIVAALAVAVTPFLAGAPLPLAAAAAGLLTIVVPALLSLTPLLLPSTSLLAGAGAGGFFVVGCRLATLPTAAGFAGGFSGDALKGERGRVLELWDLGDKTVEASGFLLREAFVLAAAVGFVAAVLARFFGLAMSGSAFTLAGSAGAEVEI